MAEIYGPAASEAPARLLGVFFAEFDNTIGPRIVAQHPPNVLPSERFDEISDFVIAGTDLCHNIITIMLPDGSLNIMGYPINISHNKYARNSFYFNLGFIFSASPSAGLTAPYAPTLARAGQWLETLEVQHGLLEGALKKQVGGVHAHLHKKHQQKDQTPASRSTPTAPNASPASAAASAAAAAAATALLSPPSHIHTHSHTLAPVALSDRECLLLHLCRSLHTQLSTTGACSVHLKNNHVFLAELPVRPPPPYVSAQTETPVQTSSSSSSDESVTEPCFFGPIKGTTIVTPLPQHSSSSSSTSSVAIMGGARAAPSAPMNLLSAYAAVALTSHTLTSPSSKGLPLAVLCSLAHIPPSSAAAAAAALRTAGVAAMRPLLHGETALAPVGGTGGGTGGGAAQAVVDGVWLVKAVRAVWGDGPSSKGGEHLDRHDASNGDDDEDDDDETEEWWATRIAALVSFISLFGDPSLASSHSTEAGERPAVTLGMAARYLRARAAEGSHASSSSSGDDADPARDASGLWSDSALIEAAIVCIARGALRTRQRVLVQAPSLTAAFKPTAASAGLGAGSLEWSDSLALSSSAPRVSAPLDGAGRWYDSSEEGCETLPVISSAWEVWGGLYSASLFTPEGGQEADAMATQQRQQASWREVTVGGRKKNDDDDGTDEDEDEDEYLGCHVPGWLLTSSARASLPLQTNPFAAPLVAPDSPHDSVHLASLGALPRVRARALRRVFRAGAVVCLDDLALALALPPSVARTVAGEVVGGLVEVML